VCSLRRCRCGRSICVRPKLSYGGAITAKRNGVPKDRSFSNRFRHPSDTLRLNDADNIVDSTTWNNFFDEVKGSIDKLRIPDDKKLLLGQAFGRMNSTCPTWGL
jgi:hypothetical protein